MDQVLLRAQAARLEAIGGRRRAWLRTARAHERVALTQRNVASLMMRSGDIAAGRHHRVLAYGHEAAAVASRRRAGTLLPRRAGGWIEPQTRVHLGFGDAESREAVLLLLHDLGPWEGGRLVDDRACGAYFDMPSDDLDMCEIAVRARLTLALHGLGEVEDLITLHASWPIASSSAGD